MVPNFSKHAGGFFLHIRGRNTKVSDCYTVLSSIDMVDFIQDLSFLRIYNALLEFVLHKKLVV